ncbi:MAG: 1,4-dihydroxy-2-naphthoate polyprenyltransferase [Cytophagales bacterium]|nr:1,4-dihydroxy-2-naphthoate polyprenyltransferase [Cytophagales bacterium]
MLKSWIIAFRLRTLPLALASIGMGTFLAAADGHFSWPIFAFCALTTVLLQILSNLANDYGDTVNGADSEHRSGPSRTVQAGLISLKEMKRAIGIFVVLTLASGIYLLYLSFGFELQAFLFFFALGIAAIGAALAYTAGRKPYGYIGLGDLSVLVFFGFVAVLGSYYLYAGSLRPGLALPAITIGLFSTAVLNVNNIRDIESDKKAGKYSIPVRIGRENAVIYHWAILATGLACALIFVFLNYSGPGQLLFLLTLPLLFINAKAVQTKKTSGQLDPYLKQMALASLLFVVLFGIGQLLPIS